MEQYHKPIKVLDYEPRSFESLGKGNWGEYVVKVEMSDGTEKDGLMQGDTHNWALETFEEI